MGDNEKMALLVAEHEARELKRAKTAQKHEAEKAVVRLQKVKDSVLTSMLNGQSSDFTVCKRYDILFYIFN